MTYRYELVRSKAFNRPRAADAICGATTPRAFEPVITAERYYRFLMYVIFGLGVMFELPVLIFLLSGKIS